ncbi:MAG: hypothetical protein IAG13_02990, partial [Deltaproteobacteria bacterium]|nr:hypothetical protein [Nannocystaceae bacterium]
MKSTELTPEQPRPIVRRISARPLAALVLASCSFSASGGVSLTPTVRMDRWDVQSIAVALRSERAGICPRESVQLAVFAEADHRKRDKHKRLETWAGQRGGGLGHMGFEEFSYTLTGGELDPRTGWFTPNPDMLATAATGFGFEVRYKREPDVAPASKRVAPIYDCVSWLGASGPAGAGGSYGAAGAVGNDGTSGSESSAG